jgi:exopolyphosphatase / guanosine-5'-triphosphate,3'-diphosphate pyrophosphatase
VTRDGLARLAELLIEHRHPRRLQIPGLKAERAPVFAGGVAVLHAVFEALELETMEVAAGALREGVLLDLVGRLKDRDVRTATVEALATRYNVDAEHAGRVVATARKLGRGADLSDEEELMLGWAALLHECGRAVARSSYHKHGAYVLANADMAGFARNEQRLLAALVRSHRGRVDKEVFAEAGPVRQVDAGKLAALLRLAYTLHRGHESASPRFTFRLRGRELRLKFPRRWLERHPLMEADLADESKNQRVLGYRLRYD